MNHKTTFYMIYVDGERSPTYKHSSLCEAESEAKRLAEMLHKETYILAATKSYYFPEKFIVTEFDELPF